MNWNLPVSLQLAPFPEDLNLIFSTLAVSFVFYLLLVHS